VIASAVCGMYLPFKALFMAVLAYSDRVWLWVAGVHPTLLLGFKSLGFWPLQTFNMLHMRAGYNEGLHGIGGGRRAGRRGSCPAATAWACFRGHDHHRPTRRFRTAVGQLLIRQQSAALLGCSQTAHNRQHRMRARETCTASGRCGAQECPAAARCAACCAWCIVHSIRQEGCLGLGRPQIRRTVCLWASDGGCLGTKLGQPWLLELEKLPRNRQASLPELVAT
jgi:hypothetical protein